jgi:uncharacterized protein
MIPFYFRNSGKPLFGIYHPPARERARNCGIVICHPIGHEYINGYRALRQLAYQLSRAGYAVLRFDYHGCGDSSGDAIDGSLNQWRNDIRAAIDEVRLRGSAATLGLVGARLGATLALQVAAERGDIEAAVLWDPVADGKRYLESLAAQHQEWLDSRPPRPRQPGDEAAILEALGFPINAALKVSLEQVELSKVEAIPAQRLLTLETDPTDHGVQLAERFKSIGADSEYRQISVPRVWRRKDGGDNVVVPAPMLQAITGWIAGMPT